MTVIQFPAKGITLDILARVFASHDPTETFGDTMTLVEDDRGSS